MGANKTRVLNMMEMRYDYVSARNVFNNWRKEVGLKEDADFLDDNALKSLLEYLKNHAAEAGRVHAAIERLILAGDEPQDAPAPVENVELQMTEEAPHFEENHVENAPVEEPHFEDAPIEEPHFEDAPADENGGEDIHAEENVEEESPADENHNDNGGKKKKKKK